jgi:MFS family permease
MVDTLSRVTTLLFALALLLIGHGLQLTLLPVHALAMGWSSTAIGLTGSSYFLGFVTGCVLMPRVVAGVGHIRSFMVLAAAATVALLGAALLVSPVAWMLFRFATGAAFAGLYMIVESWLTDVCPPDRRGTVLSVYLLISLLAMAAGQLPMLWSVPGDERMFLVGAALLTIAIIPVGLTRVSSPRPIPAVHITPRTLLKASRVAVVCAVMAGMVTGVFWTLGPVMARSFGLDQGQVGIVMSLGVLGGAASQYPVGRLSDRLDRRLVIGAMMLIGAVVGVVGAWLAGGSAWSVYAAVFALCATVMPIYALCIVLATEKTELSLVELTGGILLAHGCGSIVGPSVVAPLIGGIGPGMFFGASAVWLAAGAGWAGYRYFVAERPILAEGHAPMLPRTTQAVAAMLDDTES